MKYLIEKSNKSIKQRICDINNVDIDKLNVDDFKVDDIEIVNEFKEKLLSYSDKRFFIVGDYDCDGICATTIMKIASRLLPIRINPVYISAAPGQKEHTSVKKLFFFLGFISYSSLPFIKSLI